MSLPTGYAHRSGLKAFWLWALVADAGMAAAQTYPLILHLNSGLGGFSSDPFQTAWFLAFFRHTLLHGRDPLLTHALFYPVGANLAWNTGAPLLALLSIPLQWLWGLAAAYNILLLSCLILDALAAQALVLKVTGSRPGAFLGGLVFGFSPILMAHAHAHLMIAAAFPLPLFLLALLRVIDTDRPVGRAQGIWLGLALLLGAMIFYYWAVYDFLASILLILFAWQAQGRGLFRRILPPFAWGAATFFLLFSPVLYLLLRGPQAADMSVATGHGRFVADLLGFFLPSIFNPFFAAAVWPLARHFTGDFFEWSVYLGYTAGFLGLWGLFRRRSEPSVRRWFWMAVTFGVLSLGPQVHLLGRTVSGTMPFAWLTLLPFMDHLREAARFDIMVMLAWSVLVGYGTAALVRSAGSHVHPRLMIAFLSALIFLEYASFPFAVTHARISPAYRALARLPKGSVVLDVPLRWNMGAGYVGPGGASYRSLWPQAVDDFRWRLVSGYVAKTPLWVFPYLTHLPLVRPIVRLESDQPLSPGAARRAHRLEPALAALLDLRAVLVHPPYATPRMLDFLRRATNTRGRRVGHDWLFLLPPPRPKESLSFGAATSAARLYLARGWSQQGGAALVTARRAVFYLPMGGFGPHTLSLHLVASRSVTMSVFVHRRWVADVSLRPGEHRYRLRLPGVPSGTVRVSLHLGPGVSVRLQQATLSDGTG